MQKTSETLLLQLIRLNIKCIVLLHNDTKMSFNSAYKLGKVAQIYWFISTKKRVLKTGCYKIFPHYIFRFLKHSIIFMIST